MNTIMSTSQEAMQNAIQKLKIDISSTEDSIKALKKSTEYTQYDKNILTSTDDKYQDTITAHGTLCEVDGKLIEAKNFVKKINDEIAEFKKEKEQEDENWRKDADKKSKWTIMNDAKKDSIKERKQIEELRKHANQIYKDKMKISKSYYQDNLLEELNNSLISFKKSKQDTMKQLKEFKMKSSEESKKTTKKTTKKKKDASEDEDSQTSESDEPKKVAKKTTKKTTKKKKDMSEDQTNPFEEPVDIIVSDEEIQNTIENVTETC